MYGSTDPSVAVCNELLLSLHLILKEFNLPFDFGVQLISEMSSQQSLKLKHKLSQKQKRLDFGAKTLQSSFVQHSVYPPFIHDTMQKK